MPAFVKILFRLQLICASALVTISPCPGNARGIHGLIQSEAYAQKTVAQLIDELVQIDSLAPGIDGDHTATALNTTDRLEIPSRLVVAYQRNGWMSFKRSLRSLR